MAACRRIVDRHPTSAPLWWLCARVLTSPDGQREAWDAVDEIEGDRTAAELAFALPEDATVCVIGWPELVGDALPPRGDVEVLAVDSLGEGSGLVRRLVQAGIDAVDVPTSGLGAAVCSSDVLLLEAVAVGPTGFVAVSGSLAAATVARHAEVPVWLAAGVGRMLPARMWDAVAGRRATRAADPWDLDEEVVPLVARRPGRADRPGWTRPTSRCAAPTAPWPPSCSTPGTHRAPTGSRTGAMGEMIEFPSNGGTATGYLAMPESGGGLPLVVIQEWWGLVPHIQDVCERFAAEGFVALAPDLYRGESTTEPDEAGKLMMALNLAAGGQGHGAARSTRWRRSPTAAVSASPGSAWVAAWRWCSPVGGPTS